MEDKIIFLGTAGDSYTVGKQLRASGGLVVQIGDLQLHIDPGPGSLIRADQFGVNIRSNTAVIATNASLESCNDINIVIDAMTHSGLDKKGVLIANETIVNGNDAFKSYLTKHHKDCVERVIVLKKGQKVGIEDTELIALPTVNEDENAIGLKIITPKFTAVYSGNTGYRADILPHYKSSDILILNVQTSEKPEKGQLSTEDAAKIIKKVNPKLAVLTNFGLKMLRSDPLYEARNLQRKTGVQTVAARDGMVICPSSLSTDVRQRTLKSFATQDVTKSNISVEVKEIEDDTEETENENRVITSEQENEEKPSKEPLDDFSGHESIKISEGDLEEGEIDGIEGEYDEEE